MQLIDPAGTVVATVIAKDGGEFSFQGVAYSAYTLQCVDDGQVIGTSSVTLSGPSQEIRMTCTADTPGPWWTSPAVLAGLGAAAAAIGATAVVASQGDASGSR
jgi:hypothetical protein